MAMLLIQKMAEYETIIVYTRKEFCHGLKETLSTGMNRNDQAERLKQ